MKDLIVLVLLVPLLALAACGKSKQLAPPTPLENFQTAVDSRKLWSSSLSADADESFSRLQLAIANGVVYACSERGQVAAFSQDRGKRVWRIDTSLRLSGGVGLTEQFLLVGSREGDVLAIDRNNGNIVWRTNVASEVSAAPQAASGVVVVNSGDGHLYGYRLDDGQRLWAHQRQTPALSLKGGSAPQVVADRVISGFASGELDMLNIRDGEVIWSVAVGVPKGSTELERISDIDSDPVIYDDTIYVGAYQGRVAAIDINSGGISWSRDISSYAGLAVDDNAVYVSDADDRVWALDRNSGATLWSIDKLLRRSITGPAVQGDYVVVADFEGYVHWLSKSDGSFAGRRRVTSKGLLDTPLVADNVLYVFGKGGGINALALEPRKNR